MAEHTLRTRAARRSGWSRAGDALLTVLAAAGALCIVLVILAFTLNISLIMFSTGSMSPAIPAGSVALVREIPATEIEVGDVVTVDRAEGLPVTHRVTEVLDADGEQVTFTMQGDANADPDPAPYTVSQVRLVLGSVPHVASVIVRFQDPVVLGSLTLAAATLVTWAFWPRRTADPETEPRAGNQADPARAGSGPAHRA
ncbi:signal peptidase I [Ruania halotolerans]|uniref:signal peptidase I n=1 Tax=Ruania halotolerans TaxID=2897773 RepID=UPI001E49C1B2|nr:signal peptidase I [Ruania halotolerans]UFU06509.1 signal peptidase I [Ruania halotolerans]